MSYINGNIRVGNISQQIYNIESDYGLYNLDNHRFIIVRGTITIALHNTEQYTTALDCHICLKCQSAVF